MKFRLPLTIFFFFLIIPLLSSAQIATPIDLISIGTDPAIPLPAQSVTVEVESFSTDLNAASIVWLVDGKNFASGVGKKSIDLTAPVIGKSVTVLAVIRTVEGREVRKTILLKSGSVDLVWESEGFVPPLYKGRSSFAYENTVHVTAIPHLSDAKGSELNPKTLVYKWTKNDKVLQDQSGYGKQNISFQEEIPRSVSIKVEVGTADGKEKATSAITLAPNDPSVSFYEDNPLYGVLYNKSLQGDVTLLNQEISVRAVPYSFSVIKTAPLNFLWSVNNLERPDLSTKESIVLRTKGDVEGTSNIAVDVRSEASLIQGARNELNILFSKRPVSNNFTF